jgi:endonuclease VIII
MWGGGRDTRQARLLIGHRIIDAVPVSNPRYNRCMPEGHTIKVAADILREALLGHVITMFHSSFKKAQAEQWQPKIEGQCVTAVRSHGKNLFIEFSSGYVLYSHMLMWGSWHVYGRDEPWRKEAHKARVVLQTATQVAVLFSAPVCELLHRDALADHKTAETGPDLLADHFDVDEAERRFRDPANADREIGELIMDQTVLAGIGNVLKSEILFGAGIHPQRSPRTITAEEWQRFVTVARDLIRRSYELGTFEGAFLPDDTPVEGGKYGYVYRRRTYPCLRCATPIRMVRQGQRRRMTWYCPQCQPYVGSQNPDLAPDRPRRTRPAASAER